MKKNIFLTIKRGFKLSYIASLVIVLISGILLPGLQQESVVPEAKAAETVEVKAFPTAEGYGASSVGGRGGRIIEVTNLADSGIGSLRAALEASGPRIVVFKVSGTIALNSTIKISDPYITVAGQTAPGDGIQVRNHLDNDSEAIRVETHDVIMRFMRIRSGPTSSPSCCSGAVTILHGAYNVILDHMSLSWGVDEIMSAADGVHDYTVQWSIISQALNNSTHEEGPHSMGMLIGSHAQDYPITAHKNVSLHHNLFAHNVRRNPKFSNAGHDVLINNVMYNWDDLAIHMDDDSTPLFKAAIIGNTLIKGQNSGGAKEIYVNEELGGSFELFVDGNVGPNQPDPSGSQLQMMYEGDHQWVVSSPTFSWPSITTTSAAQSYEDVLNYAGALYPVRDSVDQYVVSSVRNRTGAIIDDPSDVGGWPVLASGTPYADSDKDGIDDAWEAANGLNSSDPNDGSLSAPNGYTWVENFLNELAGDTIPSSTSDTTPPTISNVAASNITETGATITWTTNEASDSEVKFDTVSCSISTCPYSSGVDTAKTTSHSINLSNLTSGTTYYYVVVSKDAAGNVASSTAYSFTTSSSTVPTYNTVDVRVSQSSDDAEEKLLDGSMYLDSSDLELSYDDFVSGNQEVGVRFQGVDIPYGATIKSAYLEFTQDEQKNGNPLTLSIKGQASDAPSTFTTSPGDISSRPRTSTSISWASNSDWPSGSIQKSPDISPIVQEIVNRSGWLGDSIAFFITSSSTTGVRVAESYDGTTSSAPRLVVNWEEGSTSDTTPPTISNVAASNITETGATITWTTNEASDSEVKFDTVSCSISTCPYSSGVDTAKTTSHSINLSNLTSGTTYYYVVVSKDAAGNVASSTAYSFTTTNLNFPDLVVTDILWTPSSPVTEDNVVFSATITNQGSGATPEGVVHGVSFDINGAQVSWSSSHVTNLAPGESVTVAADGGPLGTNIWSPVSSGDYTVSATVDDINRITESAEGNNARQEAIRVDEATTPTVNSFPVYRLINRTNDNHFYTIDPSERDLVIQKYGFKDEGVAFYAFTIQETGTVPVYRLYHNKFDDHFYTTSQTEVNSATSGGNAYSTEGIAFYVYTSSRASSQPVYRLYSGKIKDHFYTADSAERISAINNGYKDEGVGWWAPVN